MGATNPRDLAEMHAAMTSLPSGREAKFAVYGRRGNASCTCLGEVQRNPSEHTIETLFAERRASLSVSTFVYVEGPGLVLEISNSCSSDPMVLFVERRALLFVSVVAC